MHGFPADAFALLTATGLLAAPLPRAAGGLGLGTEPEGARAALDLLRALGRGDLAVGRLYEGHLNALLLVWAYGTPAQRARAAADAHRGFLFGVWNTGPAEGNVRLAPTRDGGLALTGAKTFCSGAGDVARALVTGTWPEEAGGGWQLCLVPMDAVRAAVDSASWRPLGMEASASYRIAFDGVTLGADALLGAPGDYYRQPLFSGGAVRFAAVQLGGAERLLRDACAFLAAQGRGTDPYQALRMGEVAVLVEGGAGWIAGAADRAARWMRVDGPPPSPDDSAAMCAYANLMRAAVQLVCERTGTLVAQSVGARGLLAPHAFGRVLRDLTMYLRQPAPDAALADAGRWAIAHGGALP